MTLNMCYMLRSALELFSRSLKSANLSVPDLKRFTADTLRHAASLTSDPLTLNVCIISAVTRSNYDCIKLSEI